MTGKELHALLGFARLLAAQQERQRRQPEGEGRDHRQADGKERKYAAEPLRRAGLVEIDLDHRLDFAPLPEHRHISFDIERRTVRFARSVVERDVALPARQDPRRLLAVLALRGEPGVLDFV